MKICLIGPTYPFRGGISHYMTLLYRCLKQQHEVYFLAFKRQYPSWLFPGVTDKDFSLLQIREEGVEYLIDSLNPFTWFKVFLQIKRRKPVMVIIPWWVAFWTPQFWTIATLVKAYTQARILFICHNVMEHEYRGVKKLCTQIVLKKGDHFIVHSGEDYENLKKLVTHADIKPSVMPIFNIFHYEHISKQHARKQLNLEGNTILFFGFVRPYKGLKYLIEAMPIILQDLQVSLLIAGEFWEKEEDYWEQIQTLGIQEKIKIVNKYIPNEEVEQYFAASDLVVLPYVSATGSAVVQTAFGCHKPVVSTNVGSLSEIITHEKTGYLIPPGNPQAIASAIISFYKNGKEEEFVSNIMLEHNKFSWESMVASIEGFLR